MGTAGDRRGAKDRQRDVVTAMDDDEFLSPRQQAARAVAYADQVDAEIAALKPEQPSEQPLPALESPDIVRKVYGFVQQSEPVQPADEYVRLSLLEEVIDEAGAHAGRQ